MTDYFDTGSTSTVNGSAVYASSPRRYTLGLSGEMQLPKSPLGLEIDALYHRFSYNAIIRSSPAGVVGASTATFNVAGNNWDFPITVKYRFGHVIHPYLAGGGVIRWLASARESGFGTIAGTTGNSTYAIGTNKISDLRKSVYPGVTVVGGVEGRLLKFRVAPEIRYTHWTANISGSGGLLRFAPNQAEFLLGFAF